MKELALLFVCSQNRCRSIAAEGVFRYILQASQISCWVDSAGLSAQTGQNAEVMISKAAAMRGYDLSALQSRPLTADDFSIFDHILAMDKSTHAALLKQAPQPCRARISLLTSYAVFFKGKNGLDYPVSGDLHAFSLMLDRIEDACLGFFHFIQEGGSHS